MKQQKFESGRREFLVKSAAVSGGLMLGVNLSGVVQAAEAAGAAAGTPEVTHWIVIQPDDTVVVRIARSELGQGSFTGLAQLVAEELECDWNKVTTECPTPGQSAARQRPWGSFNTGGSIGIRTSQQYVRRGGAAARRTRPFPHFPSRPMFPSRATARAGARPPP